MSLDVAFAPAAFPRFGVGTGSDQWEKARIRGHATGYAEGMRAAGEEAARTAAQVEEQRAEQDRALAATVAVALGAVSQAKDAFEERAEALAQLSEARVVELAVDLVETILGAELSDPVRAALTAASRAAAVAQDEEGAVVVLNPGDLTLLGAAGRLDGIAYEAADDIAPGDAAVRLPDGEVDLRVTTALQRVRDEVGQVQL